MTRRPILSEQLCFAVHATDQAFAQIYRSLLQRLDLTYPQLLVLMVLWESDDRKVGELGRHLYLQSNTLTPLLKRMEEADLLSRSRDARDERAVRVMLTAKGRALEAEAPKVLDCALKATGMTLAEARDLMMRLNRLNGALREQA